MNELVLVSLLVIWQAWFLVVVFRRHVQLGVSVSIYSIVWISLLLWAGAFEPGVAVCLVIIEILGMAAIYHRAPNPARIPAFAFMVVGAALAAASWLGVGARNWREVVVLAITSAILVVAIILFLTDRGRLQFRARRYPSPDSRSNAPYQYHYWSRRALDTIIDDNVNERSRPALASVALNLPGGLKATFDRTLGKKGRHAAATELEDSLAKFMHQDATDLLNKKHGPVNALIKGKGLVHVIAYGTEGTPTPKGGRTVLFTEAVCSGKKIAFCLFGSMENFDPSTQDLQPEPVRGVANSASTDVLLWIKENRDFPEHWRESPGKVAYKIAAPDRAMPLRSANYRRVVVRELADVEWCAIVYWAYPVNQDKDGPDFPIDLILVGRPIWARGQYLAAGPSEGTALSKIDKAYREHWRSVLRLTDDSVGWPVHLYRGLLAWHGISDDL
ncbi:MAG TPA: hypothetical protein VFX16_30385 [Pseudonocardiaceae bacterium]|nr:hypothetical protein [Pseudonocardiaceae bacterium]